MVYDFISTIVNEGAYLTTSQSSIMPSKLLLLLVLVPFLTSLVWLGPWLGVESGTNPGSPGEQAVCDKHDDNNHSQTHIHIKVNLCSASWKSRAWQTLQTTRDTKSVSQVCQEVTALYVTLAVKLLKKKAIPYFNPLFCE